MRSRDALIKSAPRQTIFLLVAILGLSTALADEARSWTASSERETSSAFRADFPPGVPVTSEAGLSLGFTMADFTGDTHPDIATVELNGFDSVSALYVIDVRFSEGGCEYLRMKAPFGGLLIAAKDVTGDGSLDLVIRSARSGIPVTVFLNDGHGRFTAAKASTLSDVLPEARPGQKFATERFYFSATLISPRSNSVNCQSAAARNSDAQKISLVAANQHISRHLFLPFGLDRAPPTAA
jgi:hypothetical protein